MRALSVLAGTLFFVLFAVGARAEEGGDALFSTLMMDIHGEPITLSRFQGNPLVVKFWERICPSCRDEIPELSALQREYKGRGLTVLGIALEEDPVRVREFLIAYEAHYPVVLGREQGIGLMKMFGNEGALLPYTLIIDREGEVVLRKVGAFKKSDFQEVAEKLLR
ncbi:MAG: TlpA family protein disulfide reductase [Betaproteobacteria bacterium]|nr:TlpA family protein disulfide reductase [Betaproteobacteria bacterium]